MKASDMIKPENTLLALLLALDLLFLAPANPARTIYSFAFIMFVPGFAVLGVAKRKVGLQEALALSAAVSIALGVVLFELLGFLVPMDSLSVLVAYNAIVIGSCLYSIRKKTGIMIEWPKRTTRTLFILSHLLVISLPVFLVFNPYISLVSDGWKHVSIVNEMGRLDIPPSDPRIAGTGLVYPWGSHLFMGLAQNLSSAPGLEVYNIFSWLSVLVLFLGSAYLARRFLGEREAIMAGLITTAMAGLSWMLLAIDFLGQGISGGGELIKFVLTYSFSFIATAPFAPLTLCGMGMMAVAIRLFLDYLDDGGPGRLWLGALVTGSLLTIEVIPAGAVALVIAWPLLETLAKHRLSWRKLVPFAKIGLSMVPFLIIFRLVYSSGSSATLALAPLVRSGPVELMLMYGIPLILAVCGAFLVLRRRDARMYVMVYTLLVFYVLFNHLDYGSLPADYRMMFYMLLPTGILGARGLAGLAGYLQGIRKFMLIFLVISVSFLPVFLGVFIYSNSFREISEDTRQVAEWLAENTPRDSVILTNPYSYHTYVPAFGSREVYLGAFDSVSAYSRFFGGGGIAEERLEKVHGIFNTTGKFLNLMEQEGIDYVFLGHDEFLMYGEPQLTKFLNSMFPVYSSGEALVLGMDPVQAIALPREGRSVIISKKELAEENEDRIMKGESAIRGYISNPSGLIGPLIVGLAYYYLLLAFISRELARKDSDGD